MTNPEENKNKKAICKPSAALISLLTNYAKEDVNFAFTEITNIFHDWLETEFADNQEQRQSALYSFKILSELGTIIKGIPKKKIRTLKKEMLTIKNELA